MFHPLSPTKPPQWSLGQSKIERWGGGSRGGGKDPKGGSVFNDNLEDGSVKIMFPSYPFLSQENSSKEFWECTVSTNLKLTVLN